MASEPRPNDASRVVRGTTNGHRPADGADDGNGRVADRGGDLDLPIGIEVRHLRYFLAVVDELHFGRAAERLSLTQPPLSRAIQTLEHELGVQLLARTSRVVTPTRAGLVFADQARKVLTALNQAVAEARRAVPAGGSLRVGCVPLLPIRFTSRFLEGLEARRPGLEVEVTHLPSTEQLRRLRDGEIDVALVHRAGDDDGLESEPLFPGEPMVAYVHASSPLARRPVLGPADLRDEPCVTFRRSANPGLHDVLRRTVERGGYRFSSFHELMTPDARDMVLAVGQGRGVSFGASSLLEGVPGAHVELRPLDPPLSMPDTLAVWRADPPPELAPVLAIVRDVAAELHAIGLPGEKTSPPGRRRGRPAPVTR